MNRPRTMIVVDDKAVNRKMLSEIFCYEYTVLEAGSCAQAAGLLRQHGSDISVVLLDMIFPSEECLRFVRTMRSDDALAAVPIVALSGDGTGSAALRAVEAGIDYILTKPVDSRAAVKTINNLVLRHEAYSRMYESELRFQAERDILTGIYNKNAFCRRTRKLLNEGTASSYAIIYIDIRRFKVINELFGFEMGNKLLIHMAEVLYSTFRGRGTFARLEADKFVVGIPADNIDIAELIDDVAEKIRCFPLDFEILPIFGIYYVDDTTKSVDSMCDRALLANRTVSESAVTRCAVYDDKLRRAILTEQSIVNDMNSAIRDGQFYICLQPQYDYVAGDIIGAEALVRWRHPEMGQISPEVFIPIFEKNGFITRLDEYVRELVCAQLCRWKSSGAKAVPISVNISRVDIYDSKFCDKLVDMVKKYSISPDKLHLEITESAYVEDARQLIEVVGALRDNGFTVEMDDFGSGYSSLNLLKDVPVDVLKLDMKFIENDGTSGRGGSILSSILGMSALIDLPVVAEGVETREQAEYLKSIGCRRMQGYYFAKPMLPEEFSELLSPSMA